MNHKLWFIKNKLSTATKIKEEVNATKEENKELKDQNEILEENALYGVEGDFEITVFEIRYFVWSGITGIMQAILKRFHKNFQSQLKSHDQRNRNNHVLGYQQKKLMVSMVEIKVKHAYYIEKSFDDNIRGSTRDSALTFRAWIYPVTFSLTYYRDHILHVMPLTGPCQIDYAKNFGSIEVCIRRGLPWYEPWVTFADATTFPLPRVNMYSCIAHNLERLRNLQCKNPMNEF